MKADDRRRTCWCGHRYADHGISGPCLAQIDDPDRSWLLQCSCRRWEPLRAEQGIAQMDGPNTHKMDAPSDVTDWTVIPTTRDVVRADGRGFESRNEWWHVPTFVVDAIREADSPLGHGTPVPEEATLPSGDARVAGL